MTSFTNTLCNETLAFECPCNAFQVSMEMLLLDWQRSIRTCMMKKSFFDFPTPRYKCFLHISCPICTFSAPPTSTIHTWHSKYCFKYKWGMQTTANDSETSRLFHACLNTEVICIHTEIFLLQVKKKKLQIVYTRASRETTELLPTIKLDMHVTHTRHRRHKLGRTAGSAQVTVMVMVTVTVTVTLIKRNKF